ncbi:MAG: nucleotide exchange factor GrpE [Flavobacteriales bacterium]|nr:nucleotide exchange factor GrpE [Flavobacteriales bacterium]
MSERPNVSPGSGDHDQKTVNEALSEQAVEGSEGIGIEQLKAELDAQRTEHQALHDKYVRLFAEFDNFRKRTAKERLDLLQMAGAETMRNILPVLDDLQRAMTNNESSDDLKVVKEGFSLIDQKLRNILGAKGLKAMESYGKEFDPDWHEAISKAPAPSHDLKGKVIDVVEPGYTLNDKVLRYAKVVVGE